MISIALCVALRKEAVFLVLKRKCGLPVMAQGVKFLVTQAVCNPSVGSSLLRLYPQIPACVNWDLKPQERLCVYNSCHNAANKPLKNINSSRMWLGWRSMHLACTHKQLSDVSNRGCVRAQMKVIIPFDWNHPVWLKCTFWHLPCFVKLSHRPTVQASTCTGNQEMK